MKVGYVLPTSPCTNIVMAKRNLNQRVIGFLSKRDRSAYYKGVKFDECPDCPRAPFLRIGKSLSSLHLPKSQVTTNSSLDEFFPSMKESVEEKPRSRKGIGSILEFISARSTRPRATL